MSFKAKVIGHRAISLREWPVSSVVAASPRQQRTKPQQRQFVQHEAWVDRNRR
jgi:hypothetical protein